MIAHLKGQILKKTNKGIILEVGQIGYLVNLTSSTLTSTNEGKTFEVYTHTHVKEDDLSLYGFETYEKLIFFEQLLTISGIGPKVALEILNIEPAKIQQAIANSDEQFICTVPGIGKKTAKRIILELKDKIAHLASENYTSLSSEPHSEAVEALIKLGYQSREIAQGLKKIPEKIQKTEEIITYFLKHAT